MKRVLVLLCLFVSAGCTAQTSVQPGDGPVPTDQTAGRGDATTSPGGGVGPEDDAKFGQKYVYSDGLEIETIAIASSRFTKSEAEYSDGDARSADENEQAGDPYTTFTMRVKNGSPATIDLFASMTVTYGPEGTEAQRTSLLEPGGLTGKLIRGKARSAGFTYLIPTKFHNDVVVEFSPDLGHDSAVFSGSIKPLAAKTEVKQPGDAGRTFRSTHFAVTVEKVRVIGDNYDVYARVCVRRIPAGFDFLVPVSLSPWSVTANGKILKPSESGSTFKATELTKGDCNAGYLRFKATSATRISYQNSLGEVSTWK